MTAIEILSQVKHYTIKENWGNIDKVHPLLILALDRLRDTFGHRIYISPVEGAIYAKNTGHSERSWHYVIPGRNEYAMAADIFPEKNVFNAWILAIKSKDFGGVGIYPYAVWPAKGLQGMLHVDVRPYIYKELWWQDFAKGYHFITSEQHLREAQQWVT